MVTKGSGIGSPHTLLPIKLGFEMFKDVAGRHPSLDSPRCFKICITWRNRDWWDCRWLKALLLCKWRHFPTHSHIGYYSVFPSVIPASYFLTSRAGIGDSSSVLISSKEDNAVKLEKEKRFDFQKSCFRFEIKDEEISQIVVLTIEEK